MNPSRGSKPLLQVETYDDIQAYAKAIILSRITPTKEEKNFQVLPSDDVIRLTFRLKKQSTNQDINTAAVFP